MWELDNVIIDNMKKKFGEGNFWSKNGKARIYLKSGGFVELPTERMDELQKLSDDCWDDKITMKDHEIAVLQIINVMEV